MRCHRCRSPIAALFLILGLVLFAVVFPAASRAQDTPVTAGAPKKPIETGLPTLPNSAIIGIPFDDPPFLLPSKPTFNQTLDAVAGKMNRICLMSESYGWPLKESEQPRADRIFANAVSSLRKLGYTITPQDMSGIAPSLVGMTADRVGKSVLMLWSGGKTGLILLSCETRFKSMASVPPMPPLPTLEDLKVMPAPMQQPLTSVAGDWVGSLSCIGHGQIGATLSLSTRPGDKLVGAFHFYPPAKNRHISAGSYDLTGEYDRASQRVMLKPGPWVKHTSDGVSALMIGSFDLLGRHFSGVFQNVTGCTSFEASFKPVALKPVHKRARKKPASAEAAKAPVPAAAAAPPAAQAATPPMPAAKAETPASVPPAQVPDAQMPHPASPLLPPSPDTGAATAPAAPATNTPSPPLPAAQIPDAQMPHPASPLLPPVDDPSMAAPAK